jgi:hypothetical protein
MKARPIPAALGPLAGTREAAALVGAGEGAGVGVLAAHAENTTNTTISTANR